jgi:DUF971 family protein
MDELFLTEVHRQPESRRLQMAWSDGHRSVMDYDYVRGFCPCAGCQGHGTGEVKFKPPAQPVEPLDIRPVGNYAISIQWSDAHDTGIFRFDFLRQICPCEECATAADTAGADGPASVQE